MQNKVVIPNKVEKDPSNKRKFKVRKDKTTEVDADIEIADDPKDKDVIFEVDKLSVDALPEYAPDRKRIRWLNNFVVRKGPEPVNQRFSVRIVGLSSSGIVIYDGNGSSDPYYYAGEVVDDTIWLTDGDPAVGSAP